MTKTMMMAIATLLVANYGPAAAEEYPLANSPRNPAVIYDAYRLFPTDIRSREQYIADHGGRLESAARRIFPNQPEKQAEFIWNNSRVK